MAKDFGPHAGAIVSLSIPIAMLVAVASCVGILTPDFYSRETLNWQTQSAGQDIIDLVLITPLLIVFGLLTFSSRRVAVLVWGGVLFYLIYTFVIYCFDVHFNSLFIVYCLTLGLSFYSFIYFLKTQFSQPFFTDVGSSAVRKVVAIYFLIVAVFFYALWMSDILPTMGGTALPESLQSAGLPTNPVHVLDLSVVLPGIFIIGILLFKKNVLGFILAPVILVFFILMDITIGSLVVIMRLQGLEGNWFVTVLMSLLALSSLVLLIWYFQSLNNNQKIITGDNPEK